MGKAIEVILLSQLQLRPKIHRFSVHNAAISVLCNVCMRFSLALVLLSNYVRKNTYLSRLNSVVSRLEKKCKYIFNQNSLHTITHRFDSKNYK